MNITGEGITWNGRLTRSAGQRNKRAGRPFYYALVIVPVLVALTATTAIAQDVTITNLAQLADVAFSANYSLYIPWTPWDWRAYPTDWPLWCDFTSLSCLSSLPTSTNGTASIEWSNVPLASVILTKNVLSGVTTVESADSTDVLATIAAPGDYQPGANSTDRWLWNGYVQATNNPDWWGLTPDQIPPPTVTLRTFLVDSNSYYSVYESNLETEAAAAAWASSASSFSVGGGMMFMAMDDESDPCTITNESAPFSVVSITTSAQGCDLVWSSCTDHVYVVQWESSLTPTSSWADVAWMWGQDGTTSWLDANAAGQPQGFYRVVRASPDQLNNGLIPYGWAVTYGLDPLDPNLPWEDSDGDGYANYTEFLNGTNPSQPESPMDVLVNQGNAYTTSLTIPIQPLSTNYPNVLMSVDPLMPNALLLPTSSGPTNYTLTNSEGIHYLYFQYADPQGHPHSGLIYKTVTVDRVPPHVEITAPASNAVVNQAFITLQGVVFDPDPMLTPDARPLSIWINGVPYWDRLGTNITVNRFPVPAGTNLFTVTIQAVDQAGNTNTATSTWTVNTSGATNAPQLSSFNIATNMLLPNVSSVWVEAAVDNSNALINAIVTSAADAVATNLLSVQGQQVNGSVPLQPGTNQIALVASDAAGNSSSNVFTIISSTEFSALITNPAFGAFATAPSNTVSGYVSALFDVGLPSQTNVMGVMINGVAAVLGTDVDTNGNVSFTTTNEVPVGVPITGQVLTDGNQDSSLVPLAIPPVPSLQYSVLHHEWHTAGIAFPGEQNEYAFRPVLGPGSCGDGCGQWWSTMALLREDDVADASGPVDQNQSATWVNSAGHCLADPHPETFSWVLNSSSSSSCQSNSPPGCTVDLSKSAFFGTWSIDGSGSFPATCWYYPYNDYLAYTLQGVELAREWDRGALTFQIPAQTDTNNMFQITFQGADYMRASSAPRDLSQITYRGLRPVTYSNDAQTVSYLVNLNPNAQYTLNQDSFNWPANVYPEIANGLGSTGYTYYGVPFATTVNAHWMQWTNFVIDKLTVQLSSSNPTNVCVSYTYVNSNASPPSVLIANTNQVVLTAAGSPDDGTGIYTWSHPRGGTFFPNGTHAATNTTYSAPELASATPANAIDKITVTYTYHGASVSTNAMLNVLRPQTLILTTNWVQFAPTCNQTNGTEFETEYSYSMKDQFGNPLVNSSPSAQFAYFETFNNFRAGSPIVANSGTLNGIQTGISNLFPSSSTVRIATPGSDLNQAIPIVDKLENLFINGADETFWNTTTLSHPALEADDTYTIQGGAVHDRHLHLLL
jgi:hypothetical protein